MSTLYPLRFIPIFKEKLWGGTRIKTVLEKEFGSLLNCGESWEISGVQEEVSVISNGFLEGNTLEEAIEIYMGELVGDEVYDKYGVEFPLLIKFIDSDDILSVQVHPDDTMARERHKAYGKTEMWYVLYAEEGAKIYTGFTGKITKAIYAKHFRENSLKEILNEEAAVAGDIYFIPAGRIHAIGPGILLTEIQQTSDITYRIYDWDRLDNEGNTRELHTDLALDAIDFTNYDTYKTPYVKDNNKTVNVVHCDYFTTNILEFDLLVSKQYHEIDSFVIYICIEGEFGLKYNNDKIERMKKGDTILLPAVIKNVELIPISAVKVLEVYVA